MRRIVLFSFLIAGLASCKKGPEWKQATYVDVNVKSSASDIQVPASLWEKVLALAKPAAPAGKKSEEGEKKEEATPETVQEPLKVYLAERNKGVLKGQNLALAIPGGGGEIDLGDYVQPLRGSYFVAFEFLPEVAAPQTHVFFLSNSVIRKLGEQKVGSGCETYFDLTKRFETEMKHSGFLVNTSEQRDVSALAGTYLFVSTYDGKLHMATLVIKDDSHRALQCRH